VRLAIAPWEGAVLWVDMGHPIVINGNFVAYMCEMCELIELPFVVVSSIKFCKTVHVYCVFLNKHYCSHVFYWMAERSALMASEDTDAHIMQLMKIVILCVKPKMQLTK